MAIETYASTVTSTYMVTATIGIGIGYRISGGAIRAPRPTVQMLTNLDGESFTWNNSARFTQILSVTPQNNTWFTYPGQAGPIQTVTLTNVGSETLVVGSPIFTNFLSSAEPVYDTYGYSAPPWTISSGTSATFGLRFRSNDIGLFNEAVIFPTNEATSSTRYDVQVVSNEGFSFTISPLGLITSTARYGQNFIGTYTVTPLINGQTVLDTVIPLSATMSGDIKWSVERIDGNQVTVRFNSFGLSATTATYIGTLTVTSTLGSVTYSTQAVNTATHGVSTGSNYAVASWLSDITEPDAMIGVRLDVILGIPTVTIGVGSGANGSPIYSQGGNLYFNPSYLDPQYSQLRANYPYWRTVYEIPLASTGRYLSKNYKTKTQGSDDYDQYFGEHSEAGSMFAVEYDQNGDVVIDLLELRDPVTPSSNAVLNQTLDRLTRSFHYHSVTDGQAGNLSRPEPQLGTRMNDQGLPDYNSGTGAGGPLTTMFRGFRNDGSVYTTLVPVP